MPAPAQMPDDYHEEPLSGGECKAPPAALLWEEDDKDSTASTRSPFACDSTDSLGAVSEENAVGREEAATPVAVLTFSPSETLIFFDWDDTLMPTSWLQHQCPSPDDSQLDEEQRASLELLAERAQALLIKAKEYGRVVIVTNGQNGWVEFSCRTFAPGLLTVLDDVKVVSARSAHEKVGVWDPAAWKIKAFQAEADAFFSEHENGSRRNIVSFGDSMHEAEALLAVADGKSNYRAKTVKLIERPALAQMQEEHELLLQCLGQVIDYDGNLDYNIGPPQPISS